MPQAHDSGRKNRGASGEFDIPRSGESAETASNKDRVKPTPRCCDQKANLDPLCASVSGLVHRRRRSRCQRRARFRAGPPTGNAGRRHVADARWWGRRTHATAGDHPDRSGAAPADGAPTDRGRRHHAAGPPEPPPVGEHRARPAAPARGARAGGEVHRRRVPDVRQRRRHAGRSRTALRSDYQSAAEALAQKVAQDPAALGRLLPAGAPAARERARPGLHQGLRPARLPAPAGRRGGGGLHRPVRQGADAAPGGRRVRRRRAAGAGGGCCSRRTSCIARSSTTGTGRVRLGDYEIAAKLSYALAGTMPDDDLFAAAARKGLANHEQVTAAGRAAAGQGRRAGLHLPRGAAGPAQPGRRRSRRTSPRFPEFKPAWRDSIARESVAVRRARSSPPAGV